MVVINGAYRPIIGTFVRILTSTECLHDDVLIYIRHAPPSFDVEKTFLEPRITEGVEPHCKLAADAEAQ